MDFSRKKLPKDQRDSLSKVRVEDVRPFSLMYAPVYVYLESNEKFVSVKAPMDFFTEEELQRFKSIGFFYLPEFYRSLEPLIQRALKVREILQWDEALPPIPYLVSKRVYDQIGPLWWMWSSDKDGDDLPRIEPFLVAAFVNSVCDPIPRELLVSAHESSIERYESALFGSAWVVFLALHLGYCDLPFLNAVRLECFEVLIGTRDRLDRTIELVEIMEIANSLLGQVNLKRPVTLGAIERRGETSCQKIKDRIENIPKIIGRDFKKNPAHTISIFGEGGFIDG